MKSIKKYGIISLSKKLAMGNTLEFGDAILHGTQNGVQITPNPERIRAVREIIAPNKQERGSNLFGIIEEFS